MASDEHKKLAQFLKQVHLSLRKQSAAIGVAAAWNEHCKDTATLSKYAQYMEKLATTYWNDSSSSVNSSDNNNITTSRIKWAADVVYSYFMNKDYIKYRDKEINIATKINVPINLTESFPKPLKLLDVGSCYNPFKIFDFLDVLAIDLYPANEMVFQCDFINVVLGTNTIKNNIKVEQLKESGFNVITFCFFLEYLPTSELRIQACINAYKLLKFEGLLIIVTPDSKHVGANSKIMKCWRYALACLGFSRIKYQKFQHMHCMAFRKTLDINIASRWATIHKEPYMDIKMNIPQDFTPIENKSSLLNTQIDFIEEDFMELPFFNDI